MRVVPLSQLCREDFGTHEHQIDERDAALYALGIGCTATDLRHVYEFHPDFGVLPTFVCASALPATSLLPLQDILPNYHEGRRLHAEQFLQVLGPLPTSGLLRHQASLVHVADRGKAAAVVCGVHTTTDAGAPVAYSEFTTFALGAGGFRVDNEAAASSGSPSRPAAATAANALPDRPPDAVFEEQTSSSQAALYRLSGDANPLHIDPEAAAALGFPRPILHGLCTLGIVARRLQAEYSDRSNLQLHTLKARFTSYVFPGETLRIETWKQEAPHPGQLAGDGLGRIVFRATTLERGKAVLTHAAAEFTARRPSGQRTQQSHSAKL